MEEKTNIHFFGCYFLWLVFGASFGPLRGVQTVDLDERVGEFDYFYEDIGFWLGGELIKAGAAYTENGGRVSILKVDEQAVGERVLSWEQAIEAAARGVAAEGVQQEYVLYYLECERIGAIMRSFDQLEDELRVPDVTESYRGIRDKILTLIKWLETEAADVIGNYIPAGLRAEVIEKGVRISEAHAEEWRAAVTGYAASYPRAAE